MNNLIALILIALSVGLSNFAASIAIGIGGVTNTMRLRIAVVFGLFETGMPIIGLFIGQNVASKLGGHANLIGGALLVLTGCYVIYGEIKDKDDKKVKIATNSWGKLLLAGLSLSIDNLIIGFSLGTYHESLILSVLVIGFTSVTLALI